MTALRMRARDFLSEADLIAVRERFTWKGVALILHAWALIIAAVALVAWWPNPLTYLLAGAAFGAGAEEGLLGDEEEQERGDDARGHAPRVESQQTR